MLAFTGYQEINAMLLYINLIILVAAIATLLFYVVNPLAYKARKRALAGIVVFGGMLVFNTILLLIGMFITWLVTVISF